MADIIFPGQLPIADLGTTRLPDNVDLAIWQGDVQNYTIVMQNEDGSALDLTGTTAQAMIRATYVSSPEYAFTCTIQNGNEVALYMPSTLSETIPAGNYIWNFQITDLNGDVRTYLAGDVIVYAEVDHA